MGVPQAFSTRAVSTLALLLAALAMLMTHGTNARGQTPEGPPEGTVRIVPPISTAPVDGGPFDVYIVLEQFNHLGTITYDDDQDGTPDRGESSNGMAAFEFTLQFDPTVVALEGAEPGPTLNATGRNFQCLPPRRDAPDKFTFGCLSLAAQPAGPQGSLTLATVTVRPLARGSSPLLLEAGIAGPLGDDAPVQSVGAAVRATGPTGKAPTATLVPGATASSSPSVVATDIPATRTGTRTAADATPSQPASASPGVTLTPTREAGGNGGGSSETKSSWRPGAVVWFVVAGGGAAAIGALGLAVTLLRRNRYWGA